MTTNAIHSIPPIIPAKAGIQCPGDAKRRWIPAFAGMTFRFGMPVRQSPVGLQPGRTHEPATPPGNHLTVIPAKAGIQCPGDAKRRWIPAFAGMTFRFGMPVRQSPVGLQPGRTHEPATPPGNHLTVIPAKAGIQCRGDAKRPWIPASAGMTFRFGMPVRQPPVVLQPGRIHEPATPPSNHLTVIPAKAGIQCRGDAKRRWIPAFAGMTFRFDMPVRQSPVGLQPGQIHEPATPPGNHLTVIPAKTGIQCPGGTERRWIPAFAGMTFRFGMPMRQSPVDLQPGRIYEPATPPGKHPAVIPAKAGIQCRGDAKRRWIPVFAGMTFRFDMPVRQLPMNSQPWTNP